MPKILSIVLMVKMQEGKKISIVKHSSEESRQGGVVGGGGYFASSPLYAASAAWMAPMPGRYISRRSHLRRAGRKRSGGTVGECKEREGEANLRGAGLQLTPPSLSAGPTPLPHSYNPCGCPGPPLIPTHPDFEGRHMHPTRCQKARSQPSSRAVPSTSEASILPPPPPWPAGERAWPPPVSGR